MYDGKNLSLAAASRPPTLEGRRKGAHAPRKICLRTSVRSTLAAFLLGLTAAIETRLNACPASQPGLLPPPPDAITPAAARCRCSFFPLLSCPCPQVAPLLAGQAPCPYIVLELRSEPAERQGD